jgi:hypothetical protein
MLQLAVPRSSFILLGDAPSGNGQARPEASAGGSPYGLLWQPSVGRPGRLELIHGLGTVNLTRLAAAMSGKEVSEAVVELIAEKLGIVGRATEDGSLGWKLLLQYVADDAKGASGNLAG